MPSTRIVKDLSRYHINIAIVKQRESNHGIESTAGTIIPIVEEKGMCNDCSTIVPQIFIRPETIDIHHDYLPPWVAEMSPVFFFMNTSPHNYILESPI